ncbi:MAG TPA: DUF5681 domain-containing protein, partial [Bacteroidia bacterium]|nr:DUF5681 domain-containing protein [Bacteroidia bacterium]
MPFTKGESGNPEGRPVGSQNKRKKQLREMIENFLVNNFEAVVEGINTMSSKDKIKFYVELLPYGLGKVRAESSDVSLDRLTDQEIDEIFGKLKDVATQTIEETTRSYIR